MSEVTCVACKHQIDGAAKICPYCGADPVSGHKVDTKAILQEVFQPRRLSTSESIFEYARHRQGLVIGATIIVAFLILAALHQLVTVRNNSAVSADPAVPLTEVADLAQPEERPVPMPELKFHYDGQPKKMRTFIVEPGAVIPPEVIAARQAAAQAQTQTGAAPVPAPTAAPPPPSTTT
jgi:hypothetical protein